MAAHLHWHRAVDPADDWDAALASHVRAVLGDGDVRTGRLCPRCGSAAHGRPWARHDGHPVQVSLSRSGAHLLTAVGDAGPVGVDVESVEDVNARWDPELVLAPGEVARTAAARASTWARKESILKAYGVGLARPMAGLRLVDFAGRLRDVPAPEGFVAALAEL